MRRIILTPAVLAACIAGALVRAARAEGPLTLDPFVGEVSRTDATLTRGATPHPDLASPEVLTLDATSPPASESASDHLTLSFELPIWISGIDGTAGVHGFTAPMHASFVDILQATDSVVGLGGRMEADYGAWIFYGDGLFMKLAKEDIPVRQTSVNFLSELAIADVGIMYQVGNWNLGANGAAGPRLSLAGGLGARYMHVGLHLNTPRGQSRQMTQDWADPLFATQMKLNIDKHWEIIGRGDVGGGGGADLTWSAALLLSYRFGLSDTMSAAVKLGYQAIGEDYHSGHGNQEFTWDAIMHGPVITLEVRF